MSLQLVDTFECSHSRETDSLLYTCLSCCETQISLPCLPTLYPAAVYILTSYFHLNIILIRTRRSSTTESLAFRLQLTPTTTLTARHVIGWLVNN